MRAPHEAVGELVAELAELGYRADVDPERLTVDPTAVWVQPRSIHDPTLAGGATLVVWLYLITANTETDRAMRLLDDLLTDLLPRYGVSDTDDVIDLAAAIVLPSNPANPLPAYRVAVDLDL